MEENRPSLRSLEGHDAVISSVHFAESDPRKLIEAVRASGVNRYLIVGGAASLKVASGVKLIDTPTCPAPYRAEAGARSALEVSPARPASDAGSRPRTARRRR